MVAVEGLLSRDSHTRLRKALESVAHGHPGRRQVLGKMVMTIDITLHITAGLHPFHSAVADTAGWRRQPTLLQCARIGGRGGGHSSPRRWREASGPTPMARTLAASAGHSGSRASVFSPAYQGRPSTRWRPTVTRGQLVGTVRRSSLARPPRHGRFRGAASRPGGRGCRPFNRVPSVVLGRRSCGGAEAAPPIARAGRCTTSASTPRGVGCGGWSRRPVASGALWTPALPLTTTMGLFVVLLVAIPRAAPLGAAAPPRTSSPRSSPPFMPAATGRSLPPRARGRHQRAPRGLRGPHPPAARHHLRFRLGADGRFRGRGEWHDQLSPSLAYLRRRRRGGPPTSRSGLRCRLLGGRADR